MFTCALFLATRAQLPHSGEGRKDDDLPRSNIAKNTLTEDHAWGLIDQRGYERLSPDSSDKISSRSNGGGSTENWAI
jgi:hypothetical protein